MIKKRKKTIVLTVIGLIIGMTMSLIFNKSENALALMPIAGALGGLIGTIIDRRNNNKI
jgi:lipoprotein signal peptidase